MSQEDRNLVSHVIRSCPGLQRSTWIPEVGPFEEGHSRFCTKIGGNSPFRPNNFTWPICEECRTPKAFVCQINIATIPPLLQEQIKMKSGLFQLWYCHQCQPWKCFDDIFIIKGTNLVVPSLQSLAAEKAGRLDEYNLRRLPRMLRYFIEEKARKDLSPIRMEQHVETEETIVMAWNNKRELPNFEAVAHQAGVGEEIKREANLTEEQFQYFLDHLFEEENCFPPSSTGTKLGGWISWSEGQHMFLDCPDCKIKMDISFLQIEENSMFWSQDNGSGKLWNNNPGHVVLTLCPECSHS